jgi:nitroreductase
MIFSKSVEAIILERISVRTYKDTAIQENDKAAIRELIISDLKAPFNSELRFEMVETAELSREKLRSLGTYGMISGAKYFIAGTIKNNTLNEEEALIDEKKFIDYGFALEKIILYLTDRGYGTCWLGGTFNKAGFARKIKIAKDEVIPAITPFGYGSKRRALMDNMIRGIAGSKYRKQFSDLFFTGSFKTPLSIEEAGIFAKPLEMVRLAPSASNRQPWRMLEDKDTKSFHLFIKRTKNYPKAPFGVDMQMLDMGIAMCHFELTCNELGITGKWQRLKKQDLPAAINANISGEDISYISTWSL